MDNVIRFPGIKKDSPPQSIEDIKEEVKKNRIDFIQGLLNTIIPQVFTAIQDNGMDVIEDDKYHTLNALLIECVKGMIGKKLEIEHPLHSIADELLQLEDEEDYLIFELNMDKVNKIKEMLKQNEA